MAKHENYPKEFDEWASLASSDPDGFEKLRQALIDQFIQEAPAERRHRLRCLQWRIEQERARSKTPLGACIRLSRMMWDKVLARGGLVDHLQGLSHTLETGRIGSRTGHIIPFPTRGK